MIITSLLCENVFARFKIKNKHKRAIYFIWCIVLVLLSSARLNIGTDYNVYYGEFQYGTEVHTTNLFCWFMHLMSRVNVPFQAVIISASCVFLIPIVYINCKICDEYKFLGLSILVGFSFYVYSFNIFRQFAAIGIMLYGFYEAAIGYKKKCYISLILCIMIHPTTVIAVVVYALLDRLKFKVKTLRLFSIIGIAIFAVFPQSNTENLVRLILSVFENTMYGGFSNISDLSYLQRIYSQALELIPKLLIVPALISLPIMYGAIQNDILIEQENYKREQLSFLQLCVKVCLLYFVAISFKFGSEMISRALLFFSIVEIFVIPLSFKYVSNSGMRKIFKYAFAVLIIALCLYTQYRWMLANGCEAYPYQWVL